MNISYSHAACVSWSENPLSYSHKLLKTHKHVSRRYLSHAPCVLPLGLMMTRTFRGKHDDVIQWKHFPRYWPFMRGIHRSPVKSPHKGQWRGALMFSLICTRINGWVNNHEAGDFTRRRAHHDVIVMDQWRRWTGPARESVCLYQTVHSWYTLFVS